MKLVGFSVQNYRSIQSNPKIALSELTVLVGPNNEGKSNLLSALVCALSLVQERNFLLRRNTVRGNVSYDYERDFPVSMQGDSPRASTKFELEFQLDTADKKSFCATVGSKLNGTLPIQIAIEADGSTSFNVKKPGRAQKALN